MKRSLAGLIIAIAIGTGSIQSSVSPAQTSLIRGLAVTRDGTIPASL